MAYSAVQIIISGFISLILGHVAISAYLWVNDWIGNIPSLFGHAVKLCENYELISPSQNNLHLMLFALVMNTHSKRLEKGFTEIFTIVGFWNSVNALIIQISLSDMYLWINNFWTITISSESSSGRGAKNKMLMSQSKHICGSGLRPG